MTNEQKAYEESIRQDERAKLDKLILRVRSMIYM